MNHDDQQRDNHLGGHGDSPDGDDDHRLPAVAEPDWRRLHDGLLAAAMVGVPIQLTDRATSPAMTAAALTTQLELFSGQPPERWPSRYRAARTVYAHTDDVPLVLDGLTAIDAAQQRLARLAWGPWEYLIVLALTGSGGLLFYWAAVLPQLRRLQADLMLSPQPMYASVASASDLNNHLAWLQWIPGVVVVLLIAVGLGTVLLRSRGGSAGRLWRSARLGYWQPAATAMGLRLTAELMQHGVAWEAATELSSQLVGDAATVQQRIRRIALPAFVTSTANSATQQQIARERFSEQHVAATLKRAMRYFDRIADSRLMFLRSVLPLVIVLAIGGSGTLAYCVMLFRPLVHLVDDMTEPVQLAPASDQPVILRREPLDHPPAGSEVMP